MTRRTRETDTPARVRRMRRTRELEMPHACRPREMCVSHNACRNARLSKYN